MSTAVDLNTLKVPTNEEMVDVANPIRRASSTSSCPRCKTTFLSRNQYLIHNDPSSPNCCPLSLFPCAYARVGCQSYHVRSALEGHQSTCPFKTVHQAQPYVLPFGSIVQWVGLEPPHGWLICDGENGTPNLSSHFLKLEDGTIVCHIRKAVQ